VTALGQSITAADDGDGTSEQLTGLIQVDADIQPGDSGGSLVDSAGRVVGVDTAASPANGQSPDGQSAGGGSGSQGFAIPIAQALQIADQIVSGDTSSPTVHIGATAFLGVQSTAAQDASGVSVAGVVDGSAAANAGLAAGDTITSVNGQAVDSPESLGHVLSSARPGDQVRLGWTDEAGQQQTATVTLGAGPAA
jgi:S1-C subfamily serine protease